MQEKQRDIFSSFFFKFFTKKIKDGIFFLVFIGQSEKEKKVKENVRWVAGKSELSWLLFVALSKENLKTIGG